MRFPVLILVPFLALSLTTAHAASLPDTGQDLCDNGSNVLATCTNANSGDTATNATLGSPIHVGSNPTGVANFLKKPSRLYERAWRTRSGHGSALEMYVKRWLAWVEGGLGGRPLMCGVGSATTGWWIIAGGGSSRPGWLLRYR